MSCKEHWIPLAEAAKRIETALRIATAPRDVLPWCGGVGLRAQLRLSTLGIGEYRAMASLPGVAWRDLYREGEASIPPRSAIDADGPCSLLAKTADGMRAAHKVELADVLLAAADLDRLCAYLRTKNYAADVNRPHMFVDPHYAILDENQTQEDEYLAAWDGADNEAEAGKSAKQARPKAVEQTEMGAEVAKPMIAVARVAQQEEEEADTTSDDWRDKARAIADELDAADARGDCYDSVRHLAERVATVMRERRIYGPRGPLNDQTVLREALQGRRWNRKR